jgi:hypothetical protein
MIDAVVRSLTAISLISSLSTQARVPDRFAILRTADPAGMYTRDFAPVR